ncbi:hypothetical protein VTN02DRAFT_4491 [Thermoascus thermophilus]
MHWRGLRLGAVDGNEPNKRRSVIEPDAHARLSEHVPRPRPATGEPPSRRSESATRSPVGMGSLRPTTPEERSRDGPPGTAETGKAETPTSPVSRQMSLRNRFSMMRFRYASDPQLSTSYAQADEEAPPVPPLPPPPTIITTAPTRNDMDLERPAKRKNKIKILPRSKKSSQEDLADEDHDRSDAPDERPARSGQGPTDSQAPDSSPANLHASGEEPGRLSITSLRSGGRSHAGDTANAQTPDTRFSESSRSDRSSGEHGISRTTSRNDDTSPSSKLFRLPRLKKSRGVLFPLPVKYPPPESSERGMDPSASRAEGPPRAAAATNSDHDQPSPLPSPTHSSTGLSSPRASAPPLFRKDSSTSARSGKSASSFTKGQGRLPGGRRGRSSTLGSVADIRGDQQRTPPNISSGRTSISASGRKSFGDLFNLSQRLRQNSDASYQRNGSPGPASAPKPGSFSLTREVTSYPEREEGETPANYLSRLEAAVHRGAIASILSKSDDEFLKTALRKYMRSFAFFGDPIDMAIRKLLMEVELPKETQQIDRVLQGFADRYHECNPGIFESTDQAYFIAFSILILHTDVFNKNNKRKMQKQDYVRNTRMEGISEDILECFYENISYTPFIHVEDEVNLSGRYLSKPRRGLLKTASSDHLSRAPKEPVDPYALILEGKLHSLRPTLKDVMNLEDSYSSTGTEGAPDVNSLHQAFSRSAILQIVSARSRPDAFMSPSSIDNPAESHPGLVDIKVAKVGLLWRKDAKKKKTRSPWQEWGALLTFSQLYLFKDVTWVKSLMSQYDSRKKMGRRRPVVFTPPLEEFKPDAIMSTDDAVALLDSNYKKHKHAFLLVRHNALEETFLANSEADMNDWLAKLNYAAALRTTGVRMKGMIGTDYEGQRPRVARMNSVTSESSVHSADTNSVHNNMDPRLAEEVSAARRQLMAQRIQEANEKLSACEKELDDLLRNARHLQVLTPIHTRAREQVILAAGRVAAKVKWVRLDIWRTKCYREVLSLDLGEEEKNESGIDRPTQISSSTKATISIPSQPSLATTDSSSSVVPASPRSDPLHARTPASPDGPAAPDSSSSLPSDARRASVPTSIFSSELTPAVRQSSPADVRDRASVSSRAASRKLERAASVMSAGSKVDASSVGSPGPMPGLLTAGDEDDEERILREAGLLEPSQIPNHPDAANEADNDNKRDEAAEPPSGEQRGRVRRSLHRTLRDSHHTPHHQRSKRGSSVPTRDESQVAGESEGLSRKEPNFTVHGKKASVITFGSEWQNMSPEQRLKLRKPPPAEESRATDIHIPDGTESVSGSVNGGRSRSVRSVSTTTAKSFRNIDDFTVASEVPQLHSVGELNQEQEVSTSDDAAKDAQSFSDG